MLGNKQTFSIGLLLIAVFVLPSRGDYRDDSKAVKVSGGEDHTLILTAD